MMKTNRLFGSLAAVALGVFLFANQSLAAAFGVSPPWITNDNLKPDSHYVYVIDLSTNDSSQEMVVSSKITGSPEILKWVTIKDKDNLTMPVGQQHTSMYVEVNVPKDAKVGRYSGDIALTVAPRNLNPDNISILLGGNIAIQLKVVNYDVSDFTVKSMALNPIIQGQPLVLNAEIKNMGNTPLSSLETKVQVLDYKTEKPVTNLTGGTLNRVIYPQSTDTAQMELPAKNLMAGQYWVKVDALKAGRSVYQNRLYMEIAPPLANNSVKTSVQVAMAGEPIQPAAPEEMVPGNGSPSVDHVQTSVTVGNPGNNVNLRTSVTVRGPWLNSLTLIVLGLLLVIAGMAVKIYMMTKKENHHAHHHPHHHQ
jgi:hypothetical protein